MNGSYGQEQNYVATFLVIRQTNKQDPTTGLPVAKPAWVCPGGRLGRPSFFSLNSLSPAARREAGLKGSLHLRIIVRRRGSGLHGAGIKFLRRKGHPRGHLIPCPPPSPPADDAEREAAPAGGGGVD